MQPLYTYQRKHNYYSNQDKTPPQQKHQPEANTDQKKQTQRDSQKGEKRFSRSNRGDRNVIKNEATSSDKLQTQKVFKKQIPPIKESTEILEESNKFTETSTNPSEIRKPLQANLAAKKVEKRQKIEGDSFLDNIIRPVERVGRYGSKRNQVEEVKQTPKKEEKEEKVEEKAKSKIILLILGKMLKRRKIQYFEQLKEYRLQSGRIESRKKVGIFCLKRIVESSNNRNQEIGFMRIKKIYSKSMEEQMKGEVKKMGAGKTKNMLAIVLQSLERQKKAMAMGCLKKVLETKSTSQLAIIALKNIQTRKLRHSYFLINLQNIKKQRESKVKRIPYISNKNMLFIKNKVWRKLMGKMTSRKEGKSLRGSMVREESGFISSVKESPIKELENKIMDKRKSYGVEKEELVLQLEEMKDHFMEDKYQIQIKLKINSELKENLDAFPEPDSEDIKLSFYEKNETKFPLLFDVYLQIYKSTESEVCLENLIEEMPIYSEENRSVREWTILQQNIGLKKYIQLYEGTNSSERKAAKALQEEEMHLEELSRNYIREKYMWEWIRSCISTEE